VKRLFLISALLLAFALQAQIDSLHYASGRFAVKDSITFHQTSTNPFFFTVLNKNTEPIDSIYYQVDFSKSLLVFDQKYLKERSLDSIQINYYTYPDFLTKTYSRLDPNIIVADDPNAKRVQLTRNKKPDIIPFAGLNTTGNIIRGIRVGNNQDAVLNSVLDLEIEGKLSSKVSLKARINDTNVPIQESGYSQDLKDLDRVYIEMKGPKWNIKAGDVFLENTQSHFMHFNKKVAGVALEARVDSLRFVSSGALVKGRFTSQQFQGQEANQGPYKLTGKTGEAYIFIISGSEKVFINGIRQTRGAAKDYIIDYNTAELTFTPTNPITADMRIQIEYQYSDRNYTRFVTHNAVTYHGEKLKIGAYFYNESDFKNQPLQINLTEAQQELLAQSTDTTAQLFVTNAIETEFDESKILYKKISPNIFEYSTDSNETLYQVSFTYFGANKGDYKVVAFLAMGKKMQYVGDNQGDYKAVIPLVAPSKQQIMVVNSQYKPSAKTALAVELAYANNDHNLFSTLDNNHNKAPAIKADWHQILLDTTKRKWVLENHLQFDFLDQNFISVERVFQVEFDRDWNLEEKIGNQRLTRNSLRYINLKKGQFYYNFDNLNFAQNYDGYKHQLGFNYQFTNSSIEQETSYLKSTGTRLKTTYLRSHTAFKLLKEKYWLGSHVDFEKNKQLQVLTSTLSEKSFQFVDFQNFVGIGDSTNVFVKLGVHFHANDSVRAGSLQRTSNAQTYYLNTQLIKSKNAHLTAYVNYRKVRNLYAENTKTINSRLAYRQQLFGQILSLQTNFQNTSGNLAQQDYTYIETEAGQGYYTWIDYNENGLQELDEFEIAQFSDQASYLRIALPNIHYIPTQEAQLQQRIQLNFSKWNGEKRFKKFVSHWYNELSILAKNNVKRTEYLVNLNPFDYENPNTLAMQYHLRNALIFNRGKAHYTTAYNYSNSKQQILQSFGNQKNNSTLHQLNFQHRIKKSWQLGLVGEYLENSSDNETFTNRNYQLLEQSIAPNILYFFNKKHWIKVEYSQTDKVNQIGDLEHLDQQQIALNYSFTGKHQTTFSIDIKGIKNKFEGTTYSAVGYQMLEGLQPDNNMTWSLLWSKKINSYLFLNLNYNGRANAFSKTVHNAGVQLRASF